MTHSMTCDQFETVLPQLLDDESAAATLSPVLRAHLDRCAECRSLLEDLGDLRALAAQLPALIPTRDLWNGIAARIEAPVVPLVEGIRVRPIRRQVTWRTAGVAAAGLVALTTAVTYGLTRPSDSPAPATMVAEIPRHGTVPDTLGIRMVTAPARSETYSPPSPARLSGPNPRRTGIVLAANQQEQEQPRRRESAKVVYDREVVRLQAIVDSGRARLDPATVALLDRNLRIIDTAIEQCNQALVKDSASAFLLESLNNAYQTKVKLLRIAAAAASRG